MSDTNRTPKPPQPSQHQSKPGLESKMTPKPNYEAPFYKAANKLAGKVAFITGGDSGIGRAVAVLFAREGAQVAFTYLPEEEEDAEETMAFIANQGQTSLAIPGDVTNSGFCREAIEKVVNQFGMLNIVVNNAAYQEHQESLDKISDEQWDYTFRTNIYGYFYVSRAAQPYLHKGDCIINTGSVVGFRGSKGLLDYSSTKGAIHAFTKSLSQNLLDKGIRVNAVAPGPIWTPLQPSDRSAEDVTHFGEGAPMGRAGQPEEVAPAYVFLASEADSGYITGEIIAVTGGEIRSG